MNSNKRLTNITGWVVFAIAFIVYFLTAERTGSLWDCGEFITGAYKLEVVHPPGAALFLIIGRVFTFLAEVLSNDPADIAFAVNLSSGICSAFAAMFICWVTIILGKLTMIGRSDEPDDSQMMALAGAGLVAGLSTAFCTSIWFSAVEGEVYAMSTFFTALTLWSMVKWYNLPDEPQNDRWVVFALYAAGLSIGVHLLSILTFPALALFYYFKKYQETTIKGMAIAVGIGLVFMMFIQKVIVVGIPWLWSKLDLILVNSFGLPINSGAIPLIIILTALVIFGLRWSHQNQNALAQKLIVSATLVILAFSTLGMVVIRANANTPINMNNPDNPFQLLTYLNREQYGERPLLKGPHFDAPVVSTDVVERFGAVGDRYEKIDRKITPEYDPSEEMLFPRMGHQDDARKAQYRRWMGINPDPNSPLPAGRPSMADNLGFFLRYQIGWMYFRYFMWNFSGRQNGEQGYTPSDPRSGNWLTGFDFIDSSRLFNQSNLPDDMKYNQARTKFYMLPFFFGLLGMFFHFSKRNKDFLGLLVLFVITGIGIIVYSNQPPNEPRERDYVLVGSFFTYCIWIGMAVLALFEILRKRANLGANVAAPVAIAMVLVAPFLMGFNGFEGMDRSEHTGARDYASNFLNSCEENAIIFTYGDNDTYPLWYAQEVEGIRTDVRVVNLSLIAVDWYINQLRRKVNDSPAIKMQVPADAIRGYKRNQLFVDPYEQNKGKPMNLGQALKFVGETHEIPLQGGRKLESYFPARRVTIPVNRKKAFELGMVTAADSNKIAPVMDFSINKGSYLYKGDLAILDVIYSNIWERPIYFSVTCQQTSMLGIQDYTQLEGLGLRLTPVKTAGERNIYGMPGNGRVNTDAVYDNIMNKFRWGNFDKERLFVDHSYGPSIQTTKVSMIRSVRALMAENDNERAIALMDKYFEAFPHMNFPFDQTTMVFFSMYAQAGAFEKAKEHMLTLADHQAQYLDFYSSLDPSDLGIFQRDRDAALGMMQQLLALVQNEDDKAFEEELKAIIAPYLGQ